MKLARKMNLIKKNFETPRLVFVNELGTNYAGENIYELIFTNSEDIYGEGWGEVPAMNFPKPPEIDYVTAVAYLKRKDVKLDLIQKSLIFGMVDAIDNVIALGWEIENDPLKERIVFKFGEDIETIKNKLYSRDILLEFNKELIDEN